MKPLICSLVFLVALATSVPGDLIISQYVETDFGTFPKGIELWNNGPAIDLSTTPLVVQKGANGQAPAADFTLNSGSIAANEVIVIGTADIGTYLDTTFGDGSPGSSAVRFFYKAFSFNGNDSLVITVGGVTQDVFGTPGTDPGLAWTGNGVATYNSNITLLGGITNGDTDGWSDPSERFATISGTPSLAGGLAGFGVSPVLIFSLSVDPTVANEGETVSVTVTASSPVAGDQVFNLAVTGAGITEDDYVLSSPTIAILSRQTSASVAFSANRDFLYEGIETARITAYFDGRATISTELTIIDDYLGQGNVFSLSVDPATAYERGANIVTITVTPAHPVAGYHELHLAVTGAGITEDDYVLSSSIMTIPSWGTSASVDLMVVDDALAEGFETATITATQLGGYSMSNEITIIENPVARTGAVAAGSYFSVFLQGDYGQVWTTGKNTYGQLGDESTGDRSTPFQGMAGVVAVSAGGYHSLFLKADHSAWSLGAPGFGQLGNGTREWKLPPDPTDPDPPYQVMTDVAAVSAGRYHSLFLKTDHTAWATGYNDDGQIGDGLTGDRLSPVQVMTDVAAVSAGGRHSVFLKTDKTAWATGRNTYGQLGDGSNTPRTLPAQVMTNVAAVSAGYEHSLFLKTDGTVWATGQNTYGQLGDGSTEDRNTPVQVMADVAAVSAGFGHSLFLKTDGTAWATGWNQAGQLGDGWTENRVVPVQVLTSVSSISAGAEHSLFLRTDDTVWGTGSSASGELGEETAAPQVSTPFMLLTWAWNLYESDGDGDGLADVVEVNVILSDPLNPDTDNDGLSDGQEVLSYKTDPLRQDTSGDGFTDGELVTDGLDPLFDHSSLVGRVVADPLRFGVDPEPWRAEGRNAVLNDPASFDLYSLDQVQALNIDVPLLGKDPGTGDFLLTIGVQKSTDLQDYFPFPMSASQTSINAEGKLEFRFTTPDAPAFFRLESN